MQREDWICKEEKSDKPRDSKADGRVSDSKSKVSSSGRGSFGKIKMLPEKDKKCMTILFIDWQREKLNNKKRFEEKKKEGRMEGKGY